MVWRQFLSKKWIARFEKPALILGSAFFLTAVLMNLEFNLLESSLYDFRMTHSPSVFPNPDIVVVTIDEATTKGLGELSPLPLNFHTKVLEVLEKYNPKAIGYLVDMNRVSELDPDKYRGDSSRTFVELAKKLKARGIPVLLGTPFDVMGEILPPYPLSELPSSLAVIHKDGNVFSEDKITRRALTYLNNKPVFHIQLAQELGYLSAGRLPRGSFYVPELDGYQFFFRYHGQAPYPHLSFLSLLENKILDPNLLNGKILLIGTLSKDDSTDYAFTPYSKKSFTNPKIFVHANILDSILQNDGIRRAPAWINWSMTFALTSFVIAWVMSSTPLYGVFSTLGLIVAFVLIELFLFNTKGLWIRASQPLVGIFVSYYLIVPYRLILEYKKRWDFQRKNEILVQVEELKTNFLSLVTHDLKTPVARIQGLAELILKKARERLVDKDTEALKNIITSTEDLNRFISSILELSKLESNQIQLSFESKDPNQIIERSIENFKTLYKTKNIKISTQLEPLFPIKLDATLISKVINNLIDNAIKYSHPESEILVQTREFGEWIEISIQDYGIGMTENEKKNLFTRFYRAKNEQTSKVAGTGLGLYLTKYFVEAHAGRVEVESELCKGSLFKIFLPIEMPKEILISQMGLKIKKRRFLRPGKLENKKEKAYV